MISEFKDEPQEPRETGALAGVVLVVGVFAMAHFLPWLTDWLLSL